MSDPIQFSSTKRGGAFIYAGLWFVNKWRNRASEIGIYRAAGLMRKAGVPVEIAVSILATR